MRVIGRLIALITGGMVLASIVAAIAARSAKQRIVPVAGPDADEVRLTAIFEPMSFRSTATSFRGGTVDCWYGGGVIDLRDAVLDPAGARLEVRAIFGGAQILVPESWLVTSNVVGLGGMRDARPRAELEHDAPHLMIEGVALFGGLGVMSEMREADVRALDDAIARAARRKHPTSTDRSPDAP
jgi:hypothetical protein